MISKSKSKSNSNSNKNYDNIDANIDDNNNNNNNDNSNNNNNNDTIYTVIIVIMMMLIIIVISFSSNNSNINPYDQLSKCIKVKVTAEELFNSDDNIRRRKSWFDFSQKSILEEIKEQNESFGTYSIDKSASNLTLLRNSKYNP